MVRRSSPTWLALWIASASSACAAAEVPVASLPIEAVHDGKRSYLTKGGVTLGGVPCGEQYRRAVAGVPAAESEIRQCKANDNLYYAGMAGFIVFPVAGLGLGTRIDNHTSETAVVASTIALGVVSFAFAYWMDVLSDRHLDRGVSFYNALRAPPP